MSRARTALLACLVLGPSLGAATGCATTGAGGDHSTIDGILHRLDAAERQRTSDARRIEDLTRRIAVLETVGPAAGDDTAALSPAAAPPRDVAGDHGPLPDLPVLRLTPGTGARPAVEIAQGPDTRVAPALFVQEPAGPDPAAALDEGIPYEGVGFGNEPGGGYLDFGRSRPTTVRLQGVPVRTTPDPATPSLPGAAAGGTPSNAFGDLPRIPTAGVPSAPTAAAPPAETSALDAAMEAYRDRRWQESIGWFDRALAAGLAEPEAAQATFLKAEATYQTRDDLAAIGLFERFLVRHPRHARSAEALLRIGLACQRLGDAERALEMYRRVVREHPSSSSAARATERLDALEGEGR